MADETDRTCEAPECDREKYRQQPWCAMHYQRMRKHGTLEPKTRGPKPIAAPTTCSVDGCSSQVRNKARALCSAHYTRWRKTGKLDAPIKNRQKDQPCSVDGCDDLRRAKGMCNTHYQRWLRSGSTDPQEQPKGRTTRRCARCDKAFKATPRQRERADAGAEVFCSRECQQDGNAVKVTCDYCGKTITRRKSQVGGITRHFCGAECRNAGAAVGPSRYESCEQCGTRFATKPSQPGRFCSVACKNEAQRNQVEWTCEACGATRKGPRSKAKGARYCSSYCAAEGRRAKPGDRYTAPNGYVWLYVDDGAGGTRRVSEHRHAWEQLLGFPLPKGVEVHHLSGDRSDNRIEATWRFVHDKPTSGNLQLWDTRQPAGQDHESKMRWAREIMAWDAQLRASGVLSA